MGWANNDRPYRPFKDQAARTAALRVMIARYHREGWRRNMIAAQLGLTPSTIGYHAKAIGLSWRTA